MAHKWIYTSHDGLEWVVTAGTREQAEAAAYSAEKRKTGSVAAAEIAAASVKRYF